jgi:uncharacterized protein with HEPN domain
MPSDASYLLDILEAANAALHFVAGKTQADFAADLQCRFAVVRAIEIIGEAARQVSQEAREKNPEIPWRDIIAMRNRVIHGYGEVDYAIVWDTVQNNLPELVAQLQPLVSSQSADLESGARPES